MFSVMPHCTLVVLSSQIGYDTFFSLPFVRYVNLTLGITLLIVVAFPIDKINIGCLL